MSQLLKSMCSLIGVIGVLSADTTPVLDIPFEKDGRKWKEGFQQTFPDKSIVEYVLNNENINNWTELVTVQTFQDVPEEPAAFYDRFMDLLKQNIGTNLQTKLISKEPNSVLGEWWIKGLGQSDQHELVRVFKSGSDIVVAHYVIKNVDEMPKHRTVWEEILKNLAIKQQIYKNNGYSMTLPGNWTTTETAFENLVKKSFQDPTNRISVQDVEIGTVGSESPAEKIKEASGDLNLWGEFDKFETLKLDDGQDVKMLVYKPRKQFRDFETVSLLAPIVRGDKFYLISATIPASDAAARSQVDAIIKSFKLESKKE